MNQIVCFGDSITAGKSVPDNRRWTLLLQMALDARQDGPWALYSRGVPGETILEGLERFEKDVSPLLPAVVLIEFGLNDCSHRPGRAIPRVGLEQFNASLREVARLIRSGGGLPVFLTNHRVDPDRVEETSGMRFIDKLEPYQAAIRAAAESGGVCLVDVEAGFAELRDPKSALGTDGVHLSIEGHTYYAEVVFARLTPHLPGLT